MSLYKKFKTLNKLYRELEKLYKGIYKFCKVCKEEDCKGYVWLLPEELKRFIERKIPLIEVNRRINFINSFSRKNGIINVEEVKPPCIFRRYNGKCSIYMLRPLVCRLYPLDFRSLGNKIYIVLHTDCLFVKKLIKTKNIKEFRNEVLNIFYNCTKELLKKILKEYELVDSISKYPKDYKHNDYIKLLKVINFKKENKNMSKCKAVLDSKKIKELRVKSKSKNKR